MGSYMVIVIIYEQIARGGADDGYASFSSVLVVKAC